MLVDENSKAGLFFGFVTAVDYKGCRIRVRLDDRDGVESFWIHVPQKNTHINKHRSIPDMGAHVAVTLAANGVDGIYNGSIYSGSEPPPVVDDSQEYVRFSDGSQISYDTASSNYLVDIVGTVLVKAADTVTVIAGTSATIDAPETTITGNATVEKQLTVKGGLAVSGGGGAAASIEGNVDIKGNAAVDGSVNASGDILAAGSSDNHHSH